MLKYFFILILFCNNAFANPVVKIVDGDTVYFTQNNKTIKVRLQCADTPECGKSCKKRGKSQYIGNIDIGYLSYQFTKQWLQQNLQHITIKCKTKDKYSRSVCYVIANNNTLNYELIKKGYAYADPKYCNKSEKQMMYISQRSKQGLWGLGWTEMPSSFRHKK
jgi:endonuclease YncB( thermonuclease family)